MPDQLTDDVVDAARDGSPEAISTIWRCLSRPVRGYLAARGVDDPDAVTSDVFVALLPRLPAVTGGPEGLRTLVYAIAHARMVDQLRQRQRQPRPTPYEASTDLRTSIDAETEALDNAGTRRVLGLLGTLPDAQRDVLVLRIVADLSIEQVATILDRSTGAVKQLQRRALLALRDRFSGEDVTP